MFEISMRMHIELNFNLHRSFRSQNILQLACLSIKLFCDQNTITTQKLAENPLFEGYKQLKNITSHRLTFYSKCYQYEIWASNTLL